MGNLGKHTRLGLVALCAALELTGLGIGVTAHAASGLPTTLTCGAKQASRIPAPGAKVTVTFAAGVAGQVKIRQIDTLTLEVVSVTPAKGWTDAIKVGAGSSVRVTFFGPRQRQVRFVARLDTTYKHLTVAVLNCS
jgi:hypothetical protein